jgi:hypothetical protein
VAAYTEPPFCLQFTVSLGVGFRDMGTFIILETFEGFKFNPVRKLKPRGFELD